MSISERIFFKLPIFPFLMKLGVLFSGGKDSCYAAYLAKRVGHELACLISILSENPNSYMFHTPSIEQVKKQAEVMELPLVMQKTKGEKELELAELEKAIKSAKEKYHIEGIISGALASNYQKLRIEDICNKLNVKCINPLWHKDELSYLKKLVDNNFKIIITGVFAYPLNQFWLGREINSQFIEEINKLNKKYKIHIAGEGGEFETFILDCPLFRHELKIKSYKDIKEGENSWRREIKVK